MQNGETASVRYETAPKKGTLMNDSAVCLNHLKIIDPLSPEITKGKLKTHNNGEDSNPFKLLKKKIVTVP